MTEVARDEEVPDSLRSRLLDHVPVGTALVRQGDLSVVHVNAAWRRLYRLDEDDAVPPTLHSPADEDLDDVITDVRRTLQGTEEWHGRARCRRADGSAFRARVTVSALHDPRERALWCVTVADASAEEAVHERAAYVLDEERHTSSALRQTVRSTVELVDLVGRDLRDPLVVLADPTDDEAGRRSVVEASRRLQRTIDRLQLQLALDTGQVSLAPQRIDLAVELPALVEALRDHAEEHRLEVQVPEGVTAVTDPTLLARIVTILVQNATTFSPTGSTVTVAARLAGHAVRLTVRDQGRGIPRERTAQLFRPLRRAVAGGEAPGLGLGLSLVGRYVSLLGGRVGVSSIVGTGTTVWFTLPTKPAGSAGSPGSSGSGSLGSSAAGDADGSTDGDPDAPDHVVPPRIIEALDEVRGLILASERLRDRIAGDAGLRVDAVMLLSYLAVNGPTRVVELADGLRRRLSDVLYQVGQLANLGLVLALPGTEDAPRVEVELSGEGQRAVALWRSFYHRALLKMDPEDLDAIVRVLGRLTDLVDDVEVDGETSAGT